jgi:hypothetical protein
MGTLDGMATKLQHRISTVAVAGATSPAPREAVPVEVDAGMDFDALNRNVAEYRALSREHGFDAALSRHAGEPLVARVEQS